MSLSTPRLVLLPLSRAMVQRRLESDTFELSCALPTGKTDVRFPASWPGDALAMFPGLLRLLPVGEEDVPGQFVAVSRETAVAVGLLGVMGALTDEGAQEIGYGFNPEVWGQGLATEAVTVLAAHLLNRRSIRSVIAQTATTNRASERVVEKAGFIRVGTSWSDDDGDLVVWRFG